MGRKKNDKEIRAQAKKWNKNEEKKTQAEEEEDNKYYGWLGLWKKSELVLVEVR